MCRRATSASPMTDALQVRSIVPSRAAAAMISLRFLPSAGADCASTGTGTAEADNSAASIPKAAILAYLRSQSMRTRPSSHPERGMSSRACRGTAAILAKPTQRLWKSQSERRGRRPAEARRRPFVRRRGERTGRDRLGADPLPARDPGGAKLLLERQLRESYHPHRHPYRPELG